MVLARARKGRFSSQREFGLAVASKLQGTEPAYSIKDGYAQKKASLWEAGQLKPTVDEMNAMSELLGISIQELQESFSTGVLPSAASDLFRFLAKAPGQGLIASCFAGRVRPKLFQEDEEALREAIKGKVTMAIFFPFPLASALSAQNEYSDALTSQYRHVWRTVVKFWKMLRSLDDSAQSAVKLYRPRTVDGGANVLFPPMFHRATLLCERDRGRTKSALYTWTQGTESDGFYRVEGRSLEDSQQQAEAWELFFGNVYDRWNETGELPDDGDSYWQTYTGASGSESDS